MNILCLKNVKSEGLGLIENWAKAMGHACIEHPCYDSAPYPTLDEFDLLIIAGGPMGVYDDKDHPWLSLEKQFIKDAIQAGKMVLGICLGAQLIAHLLGANIKSNKHKEIGWMPVTQVSSNTESNPFRNLPQTFEVLHWHGDTYELPEGALNLASSEGCANQAFIYKDRVIGIQFHIELTNENLKALCVDSPPVPDAYVQSSEQICDATNKLKNIEKVMTTIMNSIEQRL